MTAVSGPTRAHWISDAKTTHCAQPGCGKLFDMFRTRRHHCRRCGLVFCAAHSAHRMRLGPDARPSENGELSRVCDRCFHAADDEHTAADVTKISKIADPTSRWTEGKRLPTTSILRLHVAGEVVSRSRTALFKARRTEHNAHEIARVDTTVRAYAALSGNAAERAAAGVLEIPKSGDRALATAAACGMLNCRKPLSSKSGRHRCKICATIVCSDCSSKRSWAIHNPTNDSSSTVSSAFAPCMSADDPESARGGNLASSPELKLPGDRSCGRSDRRDSASAGAANGGKGVEGTVAPLSTCGGWGGGSGVPDARGFARLGPVARTCASCASLLERAAAARRVSEMRSAAAVSALATSYAQMWATTATLRTEAHRLDEAMVALASADAARANASIQRALGVGAQANLSISGAGSSETSNTPRPSHGNIGYGGAKLAGAAGGFGCTPNLGVALVNVSKISAPALHECARALKAVEALMPAVLALLKAFGAAPVEFEAEQKIKEAAMRAPAEIIKLAMPRFHSHKREIQRRVEALGLTLEELAQPPEYIESRWKQVSANKSRALAERMKQPPPPPPVELQPGQHALMKARERAHPSAIPMQPPEHGDASASVADFGGMTVGPHEEEASLGVEAGGLATDSNAVKCMCGFVEDTTGYRSAASLARANATSGGAHTISAVSGHLEPAVPLLLQSDSYTDAPEAHASRETGEMEPLARTPASMSATGNVGPTCGIPIGNSAPCTSAGTPARGVSTSRGSYAASMVGAAAAYVGATAAYAVGTSDSANNSGSHVEAHITLKEYLVARKAFVELQRSLRLYDDEVTRIASAAKSMQSYVLKLMQEELEVWAVKLGLDFNAQLLELTHAITAPQQADEDFLASLRGSSVEPSSMLPSQSCSMASLEVKKGARLSKLLGVATRALCDLEDEIQPFGFRQARRALSTLKGQLKDVYVAECIPY